MGKVILTEVGTYWYECHQYKRKKFGLARVEESDRSLNYKDDNSY